MKTPTLIAAGRVATLSAVATSFWVVAPFLPEPFEGGKRLAAAIYSFFALGILAPRGGLRAVFPALAVLAVAAASTMASSSLETAFWGRRPFRDGFFGLLPVLAIFASVRLLGARAFRRLAWMTGLSGGVFALVLLISGARPERSLAWVQFLLGEPDVWTGLSQGRPGGAMGNPAFAGMILATLSALSLGLAMEARGLARRLAWAILGTLLALGVAKTGTFAALIGCALGLMAAWAASRRHRVRGAFLFLLAGIPALLAFPWHRVLYEGRTRVHLMRAALRAWGERPWLGWGPDGFSTAYPSLSWKLADIPPVFGLPRSSHSLWSDLAACFGILGLALALILIYRTLHGALKRGEQGRLGALIALLTAASFHRFPVAGQIIGAALILPGLGAIKTRPGLRPFGSLAFLGLAFIGSWTYVKSSLGEAGLKLSEMGTRPQAERMADLDRSALLRPRDPEVLAARSRVEAMGSTLDDLESARKTLRRLLVLDPAAPSAHVDLARVSREIYLTTRIPGDLDEARRQIVLALKRNTAGVETLREAAAVFMETGEEKILTTVLERARRALPREAWPLAYIGYLQIRKGDAAGARGSLALALRKGFGGDPIAEGFTRLNFSVLLFQTGDEAAALREAQRAAELIPQDSAVHFQLGLLHLARGETPLAEADFARCLVYNPHHGEAAEMLTKIRKAKPKFEPQRTRRSLTP